VQRLGARSQPTARSGAKHQRGNARCYHLRLRGR
jgi:hypothetical protein